MRTEAGGESIKCLELTWGCVHQTTLHLFAILSTFLNDYADIAIIANAESVNSEYQLHYHIWPYLEGPDCKDQ